MTTETKCPDCGRERAESMATWRQGQCLAAKSADCLLFQLATERANGERLREALRPFADLGRNFPVGWPDALRSHGVTVGDYRRAVAALASTPAPKSEPAPSAHVLLRVPGTTPGPFPKCALCHKPWPCAESESAKGSGDPCRHSVTFEDRGFEHCTNCGVTVRAVPDMSKPTAAASGDVGEAMATLDRWLGSKGWSAEYHADMVKIRATIEQLTREHDEKSAHVDKLQSKIGRADGYIKQLEAARDKAWRQRDEWKRDFGTLATERNELKRDLGMSEVQARQAREQLEQCEKALTERDEQLTAARKPVTEAEIREASKGLLVGIGAFSVEFANAIIARRGVA